MKKNRMILIVVMITFIIFLTVMVAILFPTVIDVFSTQLLKNANIEVLILVLFTLVTFVSILFFTIINLLNKVQDNDYKTNHISLDYKRSYLEEQIIEINKKLVATDDRWRELYHLVISSQNKQSDLTGTISLEKFLDGFGIELSSEKIQADLVFVLTPFHDEFTQTYRTICDVCSKIKLTAVRGDETFIKNDILKHIVKHIVKSRVVIANLDGRNPNVFYELGIAHALNKPTILLASVETQIPVDINNQYLILYENEEQLREKLSEALLKVLTISN